MGANGGDVNSFAARTVQEQEWGFIQTHCKYHVFQSVHVQVYSIVPSALCGILHDFGIAVQKQIHIISMDICPSGIETRKFQSCM